MKGIALRYRKMNMKPSGRITGYWLAGRMAVKIKNTICWTSTLSGTVPPAGLLQGIFLWENPTELQDGTLVLDYTYYKDWKITLKYQDI